MAVYGDSAPDIVGIDYVGRDAYIAWANDVASRGGLAVRLGDHGYDVNNAIVPAGTLEGTLGERYPAAVIASAGMGAPLWWANGQTFGYYQAPHEIRVFDLLHAVQNDVTIAAGKAAEAGEKVADTLAGFGVVAALGLVAIGVLILRGGSSRSGSKK